MTEGEQNKIFQEWEADYAARRKELDPPTPVLPSPGRIATDRHASRPEHERDRKRDGRKL